MASSMVHTAGRTSYSTSMRPRASSAASSETAATAATLSPKYLTLSSRPNSLALPWVGT